MSTAGRSMGETELDHALRSWLRDGAVVDAARLAERAMAQVATTAQRRRPFAQRWQSRPPAVAWATAIGAALVVAVGLYAGFSTVGPAHPSPAPSSTPGPSPSASPAVGPSPLTEVPATSATGSANQFRIPFSYGLPAGWQLTTETSNEVTFARGTASVLIVDDARPATGCTAPIDESAPHRPDDFVASLSRGGGGFIVPHSSPTTLGGIPGFDIGLTIRSGGLAFAPIYQTIDGNGRCSVAQMAVGYHRLFALDDGTGKTILVRVIGSSAQVEPEAMRIVLSLAFDL